MSYEKYYPGGWQSGESGGTPITPEALNHIENGIKQTYSDFAPAGCGLGDMLAEQPMIADAHEIWKTGWYRVHPSVTANVPVSGVLRAEVYAYRYVTLTLYTNEYLSNDTTILRQCLADGVWKDWEFVNPPMQPGVEYRTTERRNGKPVYVKHLNLGNLVNNSYDYVEIGSTFSEMGDLKITARASNGSHFVLPMIDTSKLDGKVIAQGWQEGTSIIVLCIGDLSAWTATADIKYTKD